MNQRLFELEGFTAYFIMLSLEEIKRQQNSELSMMRPASETQSP